MKVMGFEVGTTYNDLTPSLFHRHPISFHQQYENIRERMSSQNETGDAQAIVKVVQAVLELLDNFDRAYGVIQPETDEDRAIEAEYKEAYQTIWIPLPSWE